MKNPAAIKQPNLKSPLNGKKKNNKGNLPYLRRKRQLRRDMF